VQAHVYSSEVPDDLRGPQHHKGWGDEICKWRHAQETWDQYQFGLRLGADPQTVLTTTPRPTKVYIEIINDPETIVSRGKTDDNYANLSEKFINTVYRKYKGTRLGRQELDAELLSDTPGALWTLNMIDECRVSTVPCEMRYLVVAIDPGVTDPDPSNPQFTEGHSETGIVVVGRGDDNHGYVLHDFSGALSADTWGQRAVTHYNALQANMIVGEANNGGDLVEFVVKAAAEKLDMTYAYEKVNASRGKRTRAEPVSALYEQRRQHHVGIFAELEDQMTTWIPGMKSPDRMDAMVWASTRAMLLFEKERPNVLRGKAVW
jgi:phage terminase large subunit-like protein